MREIAACDPWHQRTGDIERKKLLSSERYYDLPSHVGYEVDI